MTKKDIERGDLVLLRDGRVCVVWKDMDDPNKGLTLYGKTNSSMGFFDLGTNKIALGKVAHLFDYYDGLTSSNDGSFDVYDIMAIRKTADLGLKYSVPFIFNTLFNHDDAKADGIFWDWKREEVKEVTMAEVEEKFGCKVKIVKEESDG
jgi:hypothetical protein